MQGKGLVFSLFFYFKWRASIEMYKYERAQVDLGVREEANNETKQTS